MLIMDQRSDSFCLDFTQGDEKGGGKQDSREKKSRDFESDGCSQTVSKKEEISRLIPVVDPQDEGETGKKSKISQVSFNSRGQGDFPEKENGGADGRRRPGRPPVPE